MTNTEVMTEILEKDIKDSKKFLKNSSQWILIQPNCCGFSPKEAVAIGLINQTVNYLNDKVEFETPHCNCKGCTTARISLNKRAKRIA